MAAVPPHRCQPPPKNNMVSNDSKMPNSARNAIKKNFGGGGKLRFSAGAAVTDILISNVQKPKSEICSLKL